MVREVDVFFVMLSHNVDVASAVGEHKVAGRQRKTRKGQTNGRQKIIIMSDRHVCTKGDSP